MKATGVMPYIRDRLKITLVVRGEDQEVVNPFHVWWGDRGWVCLIKQPQAIVNIISNQVYGCRV